MKIVIILLSVFSFLYPKIAYCDFFTNDNQVNLSKYIVVPKINKELKKKQSTKSEIKKKSNFIMYNAIESDVKRTVKNNVPLQNKRVSFTKFKEVLLAHNFPDKTIDKMWCIAHHESGFNPLAYNYNKNRTFDVGLFQINQIWKRWCGMRDKELLDVSNNARCALVVLKKQGFTAWVTYKKFCRV